MTSDQIEDDTTVFCFHMKYDYQGSQVRLTLYQLSAEQMTLKGCPSFTRISLGVTFFTLKAKALSASNREYRIIFILIGERRCDCCEEGPNVIWSHFINSLCSGSRPRWDICYWAWTRRKVRTGNLLGYVYIKQGFQGSTLIVSSKFEGRRSMFKFCCLRAE